MGPRVMVVGGGIGGLALAQGLRRAGVEVAVYERDRTPIDRLQGYRIHIDALGSRALNECLPPRLFDAFVAGCGRPNTGIGLFSHHLRELIWFGAESDGPADPIDSPKSVSRLSLRHVLLAGMADVVEFDKTFSHFRADADGQVTAHFADGSSATGDLLVGADGGGSRVRHQHLPHAERIDTGVSGIQGKVWLTDEVRALLPSRLRQGPAMIPGPGGHGMFLAVHEFQPVPAELSAIAGPEAGDRRDYVMWGLMTRRANLPTDLERRDVADLNALALERIRAWHPTLRRLVAASDPGTVLLTPIRTSVPVDPWPAGNVTLLGDAIHSMPPTGGMGANTALRDAALLSRELASVARGERSLHRAIADYEAEMRRYGFDAVRSAMRNLRRQGRTESRVGLAGVKVALRTLSAIQGFRRRAVHVHRAGSRAPLPAAARVHPGEREGVDENPSRASRPSRSPRRRAPG